jgi:hypothetical protein
MVRYRHHTEDHNNKSAGNRRYILKGTSKWETTNETIDRFKPAYLLAETMPWTATQPTKQVYPEKEQEREPEIKRIRERKGYKVNYPDYITRETVSGGTDVAVPIICMNIHTIYIYINNTYSIIHRHIKHTETTVLLTPSSDE